MDLIEARQTTYGGRGYFAKSHIPKGTVVLKCDNPFVSNIFRRFKKEVCSYCFAYDEGRTLKFPLCKVVPGSKAGKSSGAYAGLYFCSQQCMDQWVEVEDSDGLLSQALQLIDSAIKPGKIGADMSGVLSKNIQETPLTKDLIDKVWNDYLEKMNRPTKRRVAPALDEVEHDIARLTVIALVKQYRALNSGCILGDSEWEDFARLQSNEYPQTVAYPPYLEAHIKTCEFLYRHLQTPLKKLLTPNFVRDTTGREAGNAFGIWETPLNLESECFGTSIRPLASYFNHQCQPTVKKERVGRSMVFTTIEDIPAGQELFISYGMMETLSFEERSEILRTQWHFDCSCTKCRVRA